MYIVSALKRLLLRLIKQKFSGLLYLLPATFQEYLPMSSQSLVCDTNSASSESAEREDQTNTREVKILFLGFDNLIFGHKVFTASTKVGERASWIPRLWI